MENPLIVGGMVDPRNAESAYRLGRLIAEQGWIKDQMHYFATGPGRAQDLLGRLFLYCCGCRV